MKEYLKLLKETKEDLLGMYKFNIHSALSDVLNISEDDAISVSRQLNVKDYMSLVEALKEGDLNAVRVIADEFLQEEELDEIAQPSLMNKDTGVPLATGIGKDSFAGGRAEARRRGDFGKAGSKGAEVTQALQQKPAGASIGAPKPASSAGNIASKMTPTRIAQQVAIGQEQNQSVAQEPAKVGAGTKLATTDPVTGNIKVKDPTTGRTADVPQHLFADVNKLRHLAGLQEQEAVIDPVTGMPIGEPAGLDPRMARLGMQGIKRMQSNMPLGPGMSAAVRQIVASLGPAVFDDPSVMRRLQTDMRNDHRAQSRQAREVAKAERNAELQHNARQPRQA